MSRLNGNQANGFLVSVRGPYRESRYTVNTDTVRDLITTGPANLLIFGDSISSWQANPRLPMGIAHEWKAPNGIAGWFMSTFQSATGALANFAGTQFESTSWPFVGFDHAGAPPTPGPASGLWAAGFTMTDYDDPNDYATTQVITGTVTPLPKPLRKAVKSGSAWNFPIFHTTRIGAMGVAQSGNIWPAGDWITGKASNALRVGMVHLAHADTVTSNMFIFTQEGLGNASAAAASTVANAVTLTAPATPAVEIAWASLAASSVNTPFGTSQNEPGLTQNPLHYQYEGIGSTVPGTVMNGTYLAAAGNADWTGSFRIAVTRDINDTPASGTTIAIYGVILEDTTNTTGLYVDNISVSGDTIRTQIDGATVAQMAKALSLNPQRPINWVLMQIGENHTTAEWNGGAINAAQIRTDLIERIARVNNGWDAAGLPRGLITLVSPWETVGGTKSGSAWYTTVASIMRSIALSDPKISFVDLRQMFADRFTTDELYNASRNAHMNILFDGVHPSLRGTRVHARCIWQAIMGGID
jgi:lysophospholipase L1-like esterase